MYVVGAYDRITCSFDGVVTYRWEDEDGNTVTNGRVLSILANDSIHHKTYSCYGLSVIQPQSLDMRFVVNGKHIFSYCCGCTEL